MFVIAVEDSASRITHKKPLTHLDVSYRIPPDKLCHRNNIRGMRLKFVWLFWFMGQVPHKPSEQPDNFIVSQLTDIVRIDIPIVPWYDRIRQFNTAPNGNSYPEEVEGPAL